MPGPVHIYTFARLALYAHIGQRRLLTAKCISFTGNPSCIAQPSKRPKMLFAARAVTTVPPSSPCEDACSAGCDDVDALERAANSTHCKPA